MSGIKLSICVAIPQLCTPWLEDTDQLNTRICVHTQMQKEG